MRLTCTHGNTNCLLCLNLYKPTTITGINKYCKLILSHPLNDQETVFLKSKIMAQLEVKHPLDNEVQGGSLPTPCGDQPTQVKGGETNGVNNT